MIRLTLKILTVAFAFSAMQPAAYACGPEKQVKGGEQASLTLPAPATPKKKASATKKTLASGKTVPTVLK